MENFNLNEHFHYFNLHASPGDAMLDTQQPIFCAKMLVTLLVP